MPTPNKNETKDKFLSRCMGDPETQKYPSDQRYAVCNSLWDESRMGAISLVKDPECGVPFVKISTSGEVTNQVKPSEK